uniref:Uncharacterized protein n=1 Tax=Anopheles culicifacies TaxID=139723 RepID=A0A182M5U5_9DIPT
MATRSLTAVYHYTATKEIVQLISAKVPGKFGQQIVYVLRNRFVFAFLSIPHRIQIVERERLFLDQETQYFFELLYILRLMQGVPQHYRQYSITSNPHCHPVCTEKIAFFFRNQSPLCIRETLEHSQYEPAARQEIALDRVDVGALALLVVVLLSLLSGKDDEDDDEDDEADDVTGFVNVVAGAGGGGGGGGVFIFSGCRAILCMWNLFSGSNTIASSSKSG